MQMTTMFDSVRQALKRSLARRGPQGSIAVSRNGQELRCSFDDYDKFPFKHGDLLSVISEPGKAPFLTPDGNAHVLTSKLLPIRIPAKVEFGEFEGLQMPLHLVMLTGAGIETMGPIGQGHLANYEKYIGLPEGASILEIGCGIGRDAFQLIKRSPVIGRYVGIDVTRDSILWCQKNITPRHPNFSFFHFNAKHELYNPLGSRTSLDFRLPVADKSVDRIFLGSVFTHLFEDEVTHYMKEIGRVLRPGGLAYATFFLYSPEIIEAARRTRRSHNGLTFEHAHGDGCFVSDAAYPTGSVAYTDEAIQRMMRNARLRLERPYLPGWWSGFFEDAVDGQEVALLTPA
jgi:SAM-dependent methyltransferase